MFARASKEIDAKGKFDAGSTRVEEDGAIVGTCAGSDPGDSYDVRVRVRGKEETTTDVGGSVTPHDARLVDVSCTCPAARALARGGAPAPPFGARTAEPPRAQPPRSCKHSTALLLWRARTLAAVADPHDVSIGPVAKRAPLANDARTRHAERTVPERPGRRAEPPAPAPERRSANAPPRPVAAKKRRLPPSLVQSASAAAEAAAKRARTPAASGVACAVGGSAVVRERAEATATNAAPSACRASAAPVLVKREPGPRPGPTPVPLDAPLSRADREIVAKVQTVSDAALLDAARRAMRGAESASGTTQAATARRAARDAFLAESGSDAREPFSEDASAAPSPRREPDASQPTRSQMRSAPAMKDVFASFLPASFKASTSAAPAAAGGGSSLEETRSAGMARPVSTAKTASSPAVARSTDGTVSPAAVGRAPADEDAKGGPRKMSFAELVASGGL